MKTLHLTAIISGMILVAIAIVFITLQAKSANLPGIYDYTVANYIPDTNKTWGIDVIQNQTFHFEDYNMSASLPKPYWIDMYDTNFTFPNGLQASVTPGGTIFEAYVTFPNETVPYRMAIGGLENISDHKVVTVLSTHKDPQAGYAIFNNTVRLLVNWPKIHSDMSLIGFNDTYKTDQPINFQIRVDGFDYFNRAETPEFQVKGTNGSTVWSPDTNGLVACCPEEIVNYDTMFNLTRLGGPIIIDKEGMYDLVVSYNHQQITKQFSVTGYHETSISDTGAYPFFANVENSNFTINYDISGNNKLLDAKIDSQSKSLILSLKPAGNGTLVVSIPRALLDAKTNDNQDDQFIILEDGQEINYKQIYSTIMDRVLSIPFSNNTSTIEIITTQII